MNIGEENEEKKKKNMFLYLSESEEIYSDEESDKKSVSSGKSGENFDVVKQTIDLILLDGDLE